jgi:hypothetical protein
MSYFISGAQFVIYCTSSTTHKNHKLTSTPIEISAQFLDTLSLEKDRSTYGLQENVVNWNLVYNIKTYESYHKSLRHKFCWQNKWMWMHNFKVQLLHTTPVTVTSSMTTVSQKVQAQRWHSQLQQKAWVWERAPFMQSFCRTSEVNETSLAFLCTVSSHTSFPAIFQNVRTSTNKRSDSRNVTSVETTIKEGSWVAHRNADAQDISSPSISAILQNQLHIK